MKTALRLASLTVLLLAPAHADAQDSSAALEAIGGLSTTAFISGNLNVGLAMELQKTKAVDHKVVIDVLTQTEGQMRTSAQQLKAFGQQAKLSPEDREYLGQLLLGMQSVAAQATAAKQAMLEGSATALKTYQTERGKAEAIIRKIGE